MIGKLKGIIDAIDDDALLLDVNGVGYHVFASNRTRSSVQLGDGVALLIDTHVREDHIHLYGFTEARERALFRLLTTVQGVGTRMAMAILGQFDVERCITTIAAQDKKQMTSVSGVGPKLAERIVTELKGKIDKVSAVGLLEQAHSATIAPIVQKTPVTNMTETAANVPPAAESDSSAALEEAVSALVNLGYNRSDAFAVIAKIRSTDNSMPLGELIRQGLQQLAA